MGMTPAQNLDALRSEAAPIPNKAIRMMRALKLQRGNFTGLLLFERIRLVKSVYTSSEAPGSCPRQVELWREIGRRMGDGSRFRFLIASLPSVPVPAPYGRPHPL